MSQKNKLSHDAYGGISGENYTPYISVKDALPELTIASIVVGCIFAAVRWRRLPASRRFR